MKGVIRSFSAHVLEFSKSMPSSKEESHPLLFDCSAGGADENREDEGVEEYHMEDDLSSVITEAESAEESEEDRAKVKVHFFQQQKPQNSETQHGEVLDVAVNVRVDSITSIDLTKQTFTGDLWLFLLTLEDVPTDKKKKVEDFFEGFDPKKHSAQWGAVQNIVTAAETHDHPQPHWYKVGNKIGLAWRQFAGQLENVFFFV